MNAQLYSEPLVPGVDPMPPDVATHLQASPYLWHLTKSVVLDFDGGRLSSDAGIVLLKDIDEQLGSPAGGRAVGPTRCASGPLYPRRLAQTRFPRIEW